MNIRYRVLEGKSAGYWGLLALLAAVTAVGGLAALFMEHHGHHVTGMTNQIVWGTPHVFAVFLIVAASGALNTASISSAFGQHEYKPLARLSGLLAVTLLVGGLIVLVLDLGRPERLIVAMTYYNFKSIFAWNIILYIGFMAAVAVYLWMMFEPRMNKFTKPVGTFAFIWRFILTTGTGSIFGFLVAREAYDAAIMAPLFIAMSLAFGTAIFLLVLLAAFEWSGGEVSEVMLARLKRLLGIFVAVVLYLTLAYHLTNLYITERHGIEKFILAGGNVYTFLFWFGQILIGGIVPLVLLWARNFRGSRTATAMAAILIVLGGLVQVYVIIIGAQAYPLEMFPGMTMTSAFFDGAVAPYTPSLPELLLGVGGIGLALLITVLAMRVLPFLPERVPDPAATQH
jgi:molybdopterin-containing oxidoreductase family membrane subunit